VVPDLRPGRRQAFGLGSVAVLVAGLGMFSFALIEGERLEWSPLVWSLLAAGVVLLAAFVVMQRRLQDSGALVPFALFRSRNFSTMTGVITITGFAMLGTFLPLTIYLQAILHMSPIRAGLTIAVMPLVSTLVAGAGGKLADKYDGKYFLAAGLVLFAAGVALVAQVADADTTTAQLILPLAVMGAGTGFTFAPLFALAFTDLDPQMSGAASGVINTAQEMGGLIATAIVGAVLQNRLVANMRAWVDEQAQAIPPEGREQFRAAFDGLTGGAVGLTSNGPAAIPPGVDPQQAQATAAAFGDAFVSAMRVSYVIPIVALLLGVAVVALSRNVKPQPIGAPPSRAAAPDRTPVRAGD
jgi:MFS family permease